MTIIISIIALSVIIVIHELGHFFAAKAVGIKVIEFSLFMGPKLFSFTKNETIYSIRAIPIGGFVSMEGEEREVESTTSYSGMPAYKKIITIVAGPAANLLFAILILFILFLSSGYALDDNTTVNDQMPAYEAGMRDGDKVISIDGRRVYDPLDLTILLYTNKGEVVSLVYEANGEKIEVMATPLQRGGTRYLINYIPEGESSVVGQLTEDSNGYAAGLRIGDRLIEVNGTAVSDRYEVDEIMKENGDSVINLKVDRNGKILSFNIEPLILEQPVYYDLGIYYSGSSTNIFTAFKHSINFSISTMRAVLMSLAWVISGAVKFSEMMGPVGIITAMGESINQPTFRLILINLANMMAFISLNLGLMNLIPFPALDGSKIVIHAIEGIRKKPFPMEKTAWITIAGFVLLIALLVFATFNDVMRLIGLK